MRSGRHCAAGVDMTRDRSSCSCCFVRRLGMLATCHEIAACCVWRHRPRAPSLRRDSRGCRLLCSRGSLVRRLSRGEEGAQPSRGPCSRAPGVRRATTMSSLFSARRSLRRGHRGCWRPSRGFCGSSPGLLHRQTLRSCAGPSVRRVGRSNKPPCRFAAGRCCHSLLCRSAKPMLHGAPGRAAGRRSALADRLLGA